MHFFDEVYQGTPLWEIGRPQPEFVRLEGGGHIVGRVLDVGCGTGENALFFASRGHETWGIDFAPTAIRRARGKAHDRSLPARFEVASALELAVLRERFDTITDSGLFHTFHDEHRPHYSDSLRSALRPGGRVYLLCFSEHEPIDWGGPRRVSQAEIRATFGPPWEILSIREGRFETRLPQVEGRAWLAALTLPGPPGKFPTQ
jgi:SAM-dependent methyltransferase